MFSTARSRRHRNVPTHDEQKSAQPFFSKSADTPLQRKQVGGIPQTPFFQRKGIAIGQPNDKYEQEADAVASKVVNKSPEGKPVVQQKEISGIQRLATSKEDEKFSTTDARMAHDKEIQEKPIQKMGEAPKEEEKTTPVQTKVEGSSSASPQVSSKIANSAGKGSPLSPKTQQEMSSSFGTDFSHVRVHNDSEAVGMNKELQAQAFTHGNDIYFNEGKYNPNSPDGKFLLAHELTHVVQQGGGNSFQKNTIQPYRSPKATHFGLQDEGDLTENDFNSKKDKEAKPWIKQITINFNIEKKDNSGNLIPAGVAIATYHNNILPPVFLSVTGGSSGKDLGVTRSGNYRVTRIEGVGYNDKPFEQGGEASNNKYAKPVNGSYASSMHDAVFFDEGRALHSGSLSVSSHGCVHVESFPQLKQINYHSVVGLTKVAVNFSGTFEKDIISGKPSSPEQVTKVASFEKAIQEKRYMTAVSEILNFSESERDTILRATPINDREQMYVLSVKGTALDKWDALGNLTRSAYLEKNYMEAKAKNDWINAAYFLNGFNSDDITFYLLRLTFDERNKLHDGAMKNPLVGINSQLAKMTEKQSHVPQ